MAIFLDPDTGRDARGPSPRRSGLLVTRRSSAPPDEDQRALVGALPVRHRIVVVDVGLGATSSIDTLEGLSAALGERRPGSVVAWDLAGGATRPSSGAARILEDVDALLAPDADPRALSLHVESMPHGHESLAADPALNDLADIEDVLGVLSHHRQTVVVHADAHAPYFARMVADADAVVVPIPHSEAAVDSVVTLLESSRQGGRGEWSDRMVVVKFDAVHQHSRSGSTDLRRTLGDAGVRTVLDVPAAIGRDVDVRRAWSHVAAVVTRTRGPVPAVPGSLLIGSRRVVPRQIQDEALDVELPSFDVTTETLRARSAGAPEGRRRARLPLIAAIAALLVAGGLGTTVLITGQPADTPAPAEPGVVEQVSAPVDPVRASGPAVIQRYDDLYYRDRDAASAAALWDLAGTGAMSDGAAREAAIVDLQRSIDAVDPAVRHRIDVAPTSVPTVFDAVLTLTVPDGREFRYNQQFTVRETPDGFAIVGKIDCAGVCPPP